MRILITGGTGLVGSNVIHIAQSQYNAEIVSTVYKRRPDVAWNCETTLLDLEDRFSIQKAIERYKPDSVIHCSAPRDEDRLEGDHRWGWAVMVTGTQILAEACRDLGAKLIFVSSDWVFGQGGNPPYEETSPPCPANYFGFLKSIGEILVASICPNYAVARIAGVYGIHWSYPDYVQKEAGIGVGWLANYFVYRLRRNEPVAVWSDHLNILSNPSLASDVANALLTIAEQDHTGMFHCCGRDSVSRLELATAVAEVFNYDTHLIRAASAEEMDLKTLEGKLLAARDSRLNVAHSESRLNRKNLGVYEGLREFKRQREQLA